MKNEFSKMYSPIKIINLEDVIRDYVNAQCMTIEKECIPEYTIRYFFQKIADKKGWSLERAYRWLSNIEETCPIAALNIILKEIAIELDKKYDDHIRNSERIFVISVFDGTIREAAKERIKSYKCFAAFRTMEDAEVAYRIVREQLERIYADKK